MTDFFRNLNVKHKNRFMKFYGIMVGSFVIKLSENYIKWTDLHL